MRDLVSGEVSGEQRIPPESQRKRGQPRRRSVGARQENGDVLGDFHDTTFTYAVPAELAACAVVGMRVDARTRAAQELERFLETLGLPVLTTLRDTQNYVQAAAHVLHAEFMQPLSSGFGL